LTDTSQTSKSLAAASSTLNQAFESHAKTIKAQVDADLDSNTAIITQSTEMMSSLWKNHENNFSLDDIEKLGNIFTIHSKATNAVMDARQKSIDISIKQTDAFVSNTQRLAQNVVVVAENYKDASNALVASIEKKLEVIAKQQQLSIDMYEKDQMARHNKKKQDIEREDAKFKKDLENIKKKRLDAAELQQKENEEIERHNDKVNEIEATERSKRLDDEMKKAEKDIDLLDRKTEIENRDLKDEFKAQLDIYKQQLVDARNEIALCQGKKNYTLTYDPPKIENKRVKPGFVSYHIY